MISCYPGSHDREQEVTQYWAICGFRKVNIRCLNMSKAKKKKKLSICSIYYLTVTIQL